MKQDQNPPSSRATQGSEDPSAESHSDTSQPGLGINPPSEDDLKKLELELAKILLSSSMDFVRNTTQILQALTGLLLTSYVALFVGVVRQSGLSSLPLPILIYFLPILLLVLSLGLSFINAVFYSGSRIAFGDLQSMLKGYDQAIKARRKHLVWPSVLTFLGIVSFGVVAYYAM